MKNFYDIKQYGDKATIYIYGDITGVVTDDSDMSAKSFNNELSKLQGVNEITMHFNSPGGSVFEGVSIYHQIQRHSAKFIGVVDGLCASISSVILMACDEVIMPSNAYLMIHNPMMPVYGNQNELRKKADDLERMREVSIEAYLSKAKDKLTREKIIEIMDNETWLLGSEALELGLCDKLEEPVEMVARSEDLATISQYKNAPSSVKDTMGINKRIDILKNHTNTITDEEDVRMNILLDNKDKVNQQAKDFQNTVLKAKMFGQSSKDINFDLSAKIESEIGQGVVTGQRQYKQTLLATTGVSEENGNSLVVKDLGKEVVTDRIANNPLLEYITLTNEPHLYDVPRLVVSGDDDGFIKDDDVAKEIKLKGLGVTFTRNKSKLKADMTETVYLGTTTDLTDKVQESLAGVLSLKELKMMFSSSLGESIKHLSLYMNDVKVVTGVTLYDGIINAINDLSFYFRKQSIVVMNEEQFFTMRKDLASKGLCKLDTKAEDLFNRPVIFIDEAIKPIVGDMKYYHLNYEDTLFEADKDYNTGVVSTYLTTYSDAHVMLSNAFRIVEVE